MKKFLLFVFSLLIIGGTAALSAQEVIAVGGGGIFRSLDAQKSYIGDFEFVEARAMFGAKNYRVGPVANVTWVYLVDNGFYYKGMIWTAGLSFDNWSQVGQLNRYTWINAGFKHSYDRGAGSEFMSWQRDNLLALQVGLRLNRGISERAWFGNNLLLVDGQFGLKTGDALIQIMGEDLKNLTPYKKGAIRATYQMGIKQIPIGHLSDSEMDLEPLLHLGYGYEAGSGNNHLEYGLGIGIGRFSDWYHDLFKIVAFVHNDLGNFQLGNSQANKPPYLQVELVVNLLNIKIGSKKETTK